MQLSHSRFASQPPCSDQSTLRARRGMHGKNASSLMKKDKFTMTDPSHGVRLRGTRDHTIMRLLRRCIYRVGQFVALSPLSPFSRGRRFESTLASSALDVYGESLRKTSGTGNGLTTLFFDIGYKGMCVHVHSDVRHHTHKDVSEASTFMRLQEIQRTERISKRLGSPRTFQTLHNVQ
jgi:hypothetical protein